MSWQDYVVVVLLGLVLLAPVLKWAKDKWMSAPIMLEVALLGHRVPVALGDFRSMSRSAVEYMGRQLKTEVDEETVFGVILSQRGGLQQQLEKQGLWEAAFKMSKMQPYGYLIHLAHAGYWLGVSVLFRKSDANLRHGAVGGLLGLIATVVSVAGGEQSSHIVALLDEVLKLEIQDEEDLRLAKDLHTKWTVVLQRSEGMSH